LPEEEEEEEDCLLTASKGAALGRADAVAVDAARATVRKDAREGIFEEERMVDWE